MYGVIKEPQLYWGYYTEAAACSDRVVARKTSSRKYFPSISAKRVRLIRLQSRSATSACLMLQALGLQSRDSYVLDVCRDEMVDPLSILKEFVAASTNEWLLRAASLLKLGVGREVEVCAA